MPRLEWWNGEYSLGITLTSLRGKLRARWVLSFIYYKKDD